MIAGIIGGIAPEFDEVQRASPIPLMSIVRAACDGAVARGLRRQAYVHDTYMSELVAGRFEEPVRERFVSIIRGLKERERIDGVVLAGTELPLLLRGVFLEGVELLDTTALHVDAIVERMFA